MNWDWNQLLQWPNVETPTDIWLTQLFIIVLCTVSVNFIMMRVIDVLDRLINKTETLWDDALARQAPKQEGLMASSSRRLERAHELLARDGITVDDLMAVTRDDEAICRVSTAPAHIESSGAAIMRPGTLDFWAVWGVPSHNEYVHVPFAA